MRIIDAILMELEQEAQTTRKLFERVPDDKLRWRPHPKSYVPVPSIYGPSADENPFA